MIEYILRVDTGPRPGFYRIFDKSEKVDTERYSLDHGLRLSLVCRAVIAGVDHCLVAAPRDAEEFRESEDVKNTVKTKRDIYYGYFAEGVASEIDSTLSELGFSFHPNQVQAKELFDAATHAFFEDQAET